MNIRLMGMNLFVIKDTAGLISIYQKSQSIAMFSGTQSTCRDKQNWKRLTTIYVRISMHIDIAIRLKCESNELRSHEYIWDNFSLFFNMQVSAFVCNSWQTSRLLFPYCRIIDCVCAGDLNPKWAIGQSQNAPIIYVMIIISYEFGSIGWIILLFIYNELGKPNLMIEAGTNHKYFGAKKHQNYTNKCC